jgi:hypothetical protein
VLITTFGDGARFEINSRKPLKASCTHRVLLGNP